MCGVEGRVRFIEIAWITLKVSALFLWITSLYFPLCCWTHEWILGSDGSSGLCPIRGRRKWCRTPISCWRTSGGGAPPSLLWSCAAFPSTGPSPWSPCATGKQRRWSSRPRFFKYSSKSSEPVWKLRLVSSRPSRTLCPEGKSLLWSQTLTRRSG